MSIIWQLLVGLIIGAIARFLLPGKEAITGGALGLLITALIGMGGSLLGTFIARALWRGENYTAGWIMSIVGAIILLLIYRFVAGKISSR
ncbi:MAG: GlsB/YeaQ/YmgE family stress response membrane protein [Actinomycetota bacterium]